MTADLQPHPATDCPCRDQVELTLDQLTGIYDGIYETADEPEPTTPVRTETACNANRCTCVEYAAGPVIDGWRHCHVCGHTDHSHKAGDPKVRKVRR